MREHIKIHDSISEVEDLRNQVKFLKNQVEELEVKLKTDMIRKANVTSKQEIPKPEIDQKGTKDILQQAEPILEEEKEMEGEHLETVPEQAPVNENKNFECDCGKKLSSKAILQRHKKFVHADVKIFSNVKYVISNLVEKKG